MIPFKVLFYLGFVDLMKLLTVGTGLRESGSLVNGDIKLMIIEDIISGLKVG